MEKGTEREKILLHSCCGPCSSACIERLIAENDISVFYYNPCIDDEDEYEKRKQTLMFLISSILARAHSGDEGVGLPDGGEIGFLEGTYDPDRYHELVKGLENEPEGGKRCEVCFRMRLEEAAKKAKELGITNFTTTLTVSPHKDFDLISKIGIEMGEKYGVEYVPYDFKKKDGFRRSVELSKEYGLYRQDYCGCNFSKRR